MPSTLRKLFRYAKSVEIDAFENFTTEALAQAVRSEPAPFLEALRGLGLRLPALAAVSAHQVITQKGMGDAGIVDLVLIVETDKDTTEVWVEVKWRSNENGVQLLNYARAIAGRAEAARPSLVVIAKEKMETSVEVPLLSWSTLWRSSKAHAHWLDLRLFLEEHGMATQFDTTPSTREASSQRDAFALLRKMENALEPVILHARSVAPPLRWPDSRKKIRLFLSKQFGEWGTMTVGSRISPRFGVAMGAYADPESHETWLGIRVWNYDKATNVRRALLELQRTGLAEWDRTPPDDPEAILSRFVRLVSFGSIAEMSRWLIARLDELAIAGVLTKLAEFKSAAVPDDDEDDEEDVAEP